MEFTDDSNDEDIFSPSPSGLGNLFNPGSKSKSNLKYQAPSKKTPEFKNDTDKTEVEYQDVGANETNPYTAIVGAFTWDGKTYKPIGKLGLVLMTQNSKPLMVLFKSKQQVLSSTDLSLEDLKVEQHAPNVLGTLDVQGRAWSFQFEEVNQLEIFLSNLLKLRLKAIKTTCVSFLTFKGSSTVKIKSGNTIALEINHNGLTKKTKSVIDEQKAIWQQHLIGKNDDCSLLLYGSADVLKNISKNCDTDYVMVKLKINSVIEEEKKTEPPKKDVAKYINKVGKAVMPVKPENITTENPTEPENITKGNTIEPENITEKIRDVSENTPQVQHKNESRPPTENSYQMVGLQSSVQMQNSDLASMILAENRLQNTEMRMSMLKLTEKVDNLLEMQRKASMNRNLNGHTEEKSKQKNIDLSDQVLKRVMNKLFKQIKSDVNLEENYAGNEVIEKVANCIKKITEDFSESLHK